MILGAKEEKDVDSLSVEEETKMGVGQREEEGMRMAMGQWGRATAERA